MKDNEMLSQEEIDALLAGDGTEDEGQLEQEELSKAEADALGEIGNITFGSASTALSTILGHKVEITTPHVEVVYADELNVEFPKPHVTVSVNYTEGFSGTNMLVIKTMDAAVIADLMMGGDGEVEDDELTDMHISAVQEAMNQMMGSAATSMSTIFDTMVNISPPTVEIIDFSHSDEPQRSLGDEMLVKISFRLTVGRLIDSYIMQLLPISFAKEMTKKLLAQQQSAAEEETAVSAEAAPPPDTAYAENREHDRATDRHEAQSDDSSPASSSREERKWSHPSPSREVQTAEFSPISQAQPAGRNVDFGLFMDIPLQVTVELGRTEKSIEELLSISPGSVIELDKLAGEPVDIFVNKKRIARGEVVVVDENFGVRVTEILNGKLRLEQLSHHN